MNIRTKQSHRLIAVFFTLNFLTTIVPINILWASNNGPNAPEASAFEPVNATDMVNLSSGDMSYVLPLLEIDGFPVTLSYHAGIPMDMEASWVGLGWNINTGAIARGVVANPDDWGYGRRLNLTYLYGEVESYSVNVGVGIAKAAEVGVGLSWGSNKSISGSVSASIGPASASIDTNGNYSLGVSNGILKEGAFEGVFDKITSSSSKKSLFGGSLSLSGNVNKGGIAANIGFGGSSSKGLSAGMGVSISENGVGTSFSVGKGNNTSGSSARSVGAGMNMNSFSAGDYSYNTKGFYIPLQIGVFSFGFGYSKTEIELAKAYNKYAYGILYHNVTSGNNYDKLYNTTLGDDTLYPYNDSTDDYQRRNVFGDVYEQILPQSEEDFIGDYRSQVEKLNFTFGGYDSYDINASGIGGELKPIVGQNSVLIGEGYDGTSVRSSDKKTKVFYHNAKGHPALKQVKGINKTNTDPNKLNFSFDGQITENAIVNNNNISIIDYTGSTLDIRNFISGGNTIVSRPKSGSYVEVYTNEQINTNYDVSQKGVLLPASLKTDSGAISRENAGYIPEGIGGYKITTPDGKIYHFMQPVYHYEQVQHNFVNFEADNTSKYNSSSKREATPYATHWLLTAITGPDFIDVNNNNFPDEMDYGYWLRLDHGQWSNAFAWRSPYDTKDYSQDTNLFDQARRHYSTFIDGEVEKSDPGYFIQGRKDLYYLDRIVSKKQTAYFVKDIRYDAFGTSAKYKFLQSVSSISPFGQQWQISPTSFDDPIESNPTLGEEEVWYDKEYQLRLDKIIIVNNNGTQTIINKDSGNGILNGISQVVYLPTDRYKVSNSFFSLNIPQISKTHKLHLSDNIIDVNDLESFDYSQATKVIKFNQDYSLAKNSLSSGYDRESNPNNPHFGRLTLKSIKTYGGGTVPNASENQLYDYMPPYKFSYITHYDNGDGTAIEIKHEENHIEPISGSIPNFPGKQQYKYVRAAKDNWGFINKRVGPDINNDGIPDINAVDAWSLREIETPQGATIEVKYEEDDFHVEAFGRRYWEKNLAFKFSKISDTNFKLQIQNQSNLDPLAVVSDFNDYFEIGEKVFLDFYLCRMKEDSDWSDDIRGAVDIRVDDLVTVESIETISSGVQILTFDIVDTGFHNLHTNNTVGIYGDPSPSIVRDKWFDDIGGYFCFGCSPFDYPYGPSTYLGERKDRARGQCPTDSQGPGYNLKYKLIANKVPPGTSGGGLRVKDIVVKDNLGSKFITRYDYDNPFKGRTSGITSFNPIRGEVFVPYQNELPGPGVMYEWITMKAIQVGENEVEKEIGSTRYHYYTLNPYFPIFDPNIEMTDIDGDPIFKATVEEIPMSFADLTAKDMYIEKNLTKIGQLISIEEFNEQGHLMSKTTNSYQPRYGELSETFSSMKSVFDFEEDDDYNEINFDLQQHYLSMSTKSEKVSMLKSVKNITTAGASEVRYSEPDEYLGTYTVSERTLSDGTSITEKKIPAYKKYPEMASKIIDPTNKNMLTQEAMTVSKVSTNGGYSWNTINASINTWNDTWKYRDDFGNETTESGIWRKHKTFVWKDDVSSINGFYSTNVSESNDYFNWGTGIPTNNKWQNVSEITRYTHWSSPVETKDISNNFASSKMADNFSKVIAGGNARYSEMYFSGAEYVKSGNTFEGEVEGANYQTNEVSHTGEYAVKNNNANDKVFVVSGVIGNNHDDLSKDFRPGKYKVSFWSHKQMGTDNATIKLNNQAVSVSETVEAGCWKQFNYYVDLTANSTFELFVTNTSGGGFYFDDFRMHPVYSSMNSFVYDQNTDELLYIMDANNMATAYRYDDAGRLKTTYKEVEDTSEFEGGFKIVQQYKYHYQNISSSVNYNEDINNCIDQTYPPLTLKGLVRNCTPEFNPYDIEYAMHVYGGSGNYKYEWQWLTDASSGQFSNWVESGLYQFVPYAPKYCEPEWFNKQWTVNVRVSDLTTGEVLNASDDFIIEGCSNYISDPKVLIGVEASKCHDKCGDSEYQFHLYPLDGNIAIPYPTAYIDNNTGNTVNLDLVHGDGLFCPEIRYVETSECETGFIQYVSVTPTYPDTTSYTYEFYLDCVSEQELGENPQYKIGASNDPKYAKPGIMIQKVDGKIISVYDINNIKK